MKEEMEILTSLDVEELEALADSNLAPSSQARLDELFARNSERRLIGENAAELNQLLCKVDQLTILKTRARFTLRKQKRLAGERFRSVRISSIIPVIFQTYELGASMSSIEIRSKVDADGILNLSVPIGTSSANREVKVTVESIDDLETAMLPDAWMSFVHEMAGSIDDPTFDRHGQMEFEQRADLFP